MGRPQDPRARIELLQAAEEEFIEHGLERAKVERITSRAGRSKGSFYLHFPSKEDIFRQIVESLVARLACCVDEPPPDDVGFEQVVTKMMQQGLEVYEFLWSNRALMRLLLSGGGGAGFGYLIDALSEQFEQSLVRWIRWGIERGYYRDDLDVEQAARMLAGAHDRLVRRMVCQARKPDLVATLREAERFTARALGKPEYIEQFDRLVRNLQARA